MFREWNHIFKENVAISCEIYIITHFKMIRVSYERRTLFAPDDDKYGDSQTATSEILPQNKKYGWIEFILETSRKRFVAPFVLKKTQHMDHKSFQC